MFMLDIHTFSRVFFNGRTTIGRLQMLFGLIGGLGDNWVIRLHILVKRKLINKVGMTEFGSSSA